MKLAIVDTMFSRVNMGEIALDELKKTHAAVEIIRKTVPGVKDLPVECKKLLDSGCDVALALGMVGGAPVDAVCAHEASLGIQQAKLMTNKHIVEVFVHENEAWSEAEFFSICDNRVRKHAHNAVDLVLYPEKLIADAGKGVRQGKENEGEIVPEAERKTRLGIVVATFNSELTEEMLKMA
ncbi:MAG: riboflavin synthase, partial [Candidatus Micrarchaeota archaeon]